MKELQTIEEQYVTIKEAANTAPYSRDYITRLAREKKITAKLIGRQWYVDSESLKSYVRTMEQEAQIRKRRLSEERKLERQVHSAIESKQAHYTREVHSGKGLALAVSSLVLMAGMFTGFGILGINSFGLVDDYNNQLGSVSEAVTSQDAKKASPVEVKFDRTVKQTEFMSAESGLLILPKSGVFLEEIDEYFSSDIEVVTDRNENSYLVAVDVNGKATGKLIPFLEVPVGNKGIDE